MSGPTKRQVWETTTRSLHNKPIIAAVHGHVLEAGLAIALAADLIVADRSARFQVTEAQRGLSTLPFLVALRDRGLGASALVSAVVHFLDAAQRAGASVVPHSFYPGPGLLATLHVASLLPDGAMIEWMTAEPEAWPLGKALRPTGGELVVPEGPGLGADPDVVAAYCTDPHVW